MLKIVILLLCLSTLPCHASNDFVKQCNSFRNELNFQSQLTGTNFDLKFSGYVDDFGGKLSRYTLLSFGTSSLKIPFVGDEQINLSLSINSIVKKTNSGSVIISFYSDTQYTDVRSELLNIKESTLPLFKNPVLHGWLVYKGFEYTTADLNCSAGMLEAQKIIAYLNAKALLSESEAKVLRLKDYDVGIIQINELKNIVSLMLLESDNVLKVTFKAKPYINIFNWLGIEKSLDLTS